MSDVRPAIPSRPPDPSMEKVEAPPQNLLPIDDLKRRLSNVPLVRQEGRVSQALGTVIEACLPGVSLGSLVYVGQVEAEVVGFRENQAILMPLGPTSGIAQGTPVHVRSTSLRVPAGEGLVGRVLGPLGQPLDGQPIDPNMETRSLEASAPNPLLRTCITEPLPTGVRVMDGLLNLGLGQRISIMAGSGVGKSTLLGMLARHTQADVNVIALVGERGRELREFMERDLGPTGRARSVVVVATSDSSPILQVKAVLTAMTVAESFRDRGKRVLLMVDSLTRLALAQRQIGLAAGEPPTSRGYTPSVFALLPRLLERAGPGAGKGSITGIFTVLVEGDDMQDPIGDAVRGIVDGHVVLSRRLGTHGHYPAVDVLESLSRTMSVTASKEHRKAATRFRDLLATWRENEELIRLGAYKSGSDPEVDAAIAMKGELDGFLRQAVDEPTPYPACVERLAKIAADPRSVPRGR